MPSTNPNDRNRQLALNISAQPTFAHPEYVYWMPEWEILRDTFLGEVEVKRKGTKYLPALEDQTPGEYDAYLDRAVFFNMTGRTVSGIVGTLFRRDPIISGLPKKFEKAVKAISKANEGYALFAKMTAQEIVHVGRVGVLLDMDEDGKKPPFLASYLAENIIDWDVEVIDGRFELTRVVLREVRVTRENQAVARQYFAAYRVLILENGVYRQEVYEKENANADLTGDPSTVVVPKNRGNALNYIPFVMFGPYSNNPDVEKSPVLDIAKLNLSHYKSYAHLEHGRFFTACPIYYAQTNGNVEAQEYKLGPSTVWEVGPNEKPGVIEFNGNGLKFLETALDMKESQISALGGRMLGTRSGSTAESDNLVKLKERNEQSTLLNVSQTLDAGFTKLIRWWLIWQDVTQEAADEVSMEINKDFLFDNISAREFRAIHSMYMDGVIPIDVVYDYLRRAEVIPAWMQVEEFKALLDNPKNFPLQPDALARAEGYPNMQSKIDDENADLDREHDIDTQDNQGEVDKDVQQQELDHEASEAEKQRKADEKKAKEDRKAAADAAKAAARAAPPGTPQRPGTPGTRRPVTPGRQGTGKK